MARMIIALRKKEEYQDLGHLELGQFKGIINKTGKKSGNTQKLERLIRFRLTYGYGITVRLSK